MLAITIAIRTKVDGPKSRITANAATIIDAIALAINSNAFQWHGHHTTKGKRPE